MLFPNNSQQQRPLTAFKNPLNINFNSNNNTLSFNANSSHNQYYDNNNRTSATTPSGFNLKQYYRNLKLLSPAPDQSSEYGYVKSLER